jgi:hypothetical protein
MTELLTDEFIEKAAETKPDSLYGTAYWKEILDFKFNEMIVSNTELYQFYVFLVVLMINIMFIHVVDPQTDDDPSNDNADYTFMSLQYAVNGRRNKYLVACRFVGLFYCIMVLEEEAT